jgi:hypothetical protein
VSEIIGEVHGRHTPGAELSLDAIAAAEGCVEVHQRGHLIRCEDAGTATSVACALLDAVGQEGAGAFFVRVYGVPATDKQMAIEKALAVDVLANL